MLTPEGQPTSLLAAPGRGVGRTNSSSNNAGATP